MDKLKAAFEWLNGKKTVIGGIAANVVVWAVLKGKLDPDTAELIMILVTGLTGAGLAHKGVKSAQGMK